MKKLISLILILCMACMLVPAMAEDAAGIWYAVEMTSEGLTIKPAEVGMSMTLELKEDGTAEMVMEMAGQKDTDAGTWSVEGDTLSMTFKEATLTATIADGKFAMEQDGANITFSKEAPEVANPLFPSLSAVYTSPGPVRSSLEAKKLRTFQDLL